jgi:hypothetical protein
MEQTLDARTAGVGAGSIAARALSTASWPAIIAGAFVAAGVSLVLLALGSGIGFASISPWPERGVSATTFTVTTAIWLIVTQWLSAGVGGYIAGRLRNRWEGTHAHEVFFRDTAHGLVTWAVATVLIAAGLASSVFSAIGGGAHAVTNVASAGAQGAMSAMSPPAADYGLDRLFRSATAGAGAQSGAEPRAGADPRGEAGHIIANAVATGDVPEDDRAYLADLVAARTGVSSAEARKRVDDLIASAVEAQQKVKAAADAARKAAAEASIYTALSLLVGAFIASVAAALGGRLRDQHL